VRLAGLLATVTLALALIPSAASAHSLQSSTISIRVDDASVTATISVATATASTAAGSTDPNAIAQYLTEHFSVVGSSGSAWDETVTDVAEETVDGIASVSVDVALDTRGDDPEAFTIGFDGIIESDDAHEAVVVLRDANGDFSTGAIVDHGLATVIGQP
jgi:hypothetical protein